jgi:hypothetical protein
MPIPVTDTAYIVSIKIGFLDIEKIATGLEALYISEHLDWEVVFGDLEDAKEVVETYFSVKEWLSSEGPYDTVHWCHAVVAKTWQVPSIPYEFGTKITIGLVPRGVWGNLPGGGGPPAPPPPEGMQIPVDDYIYIASMKLGFFNLSDLPDVAGEVFNSIEHMDWEVLFPDLSDGKELIEEYFEIESWREIIGPYPVVHWWTYATVLKDYASSTMPWDFGTKITIALVPRGLYGGGV